MKNIQVIDDAINARYGIYSVTNDEFYSIFPAAGQDIEFIEDVIERLGVDKAGELMGPIWERTVAKPEVRGIHGTLFYGLQEKRKFYEDKREPVIDWRLVE
jgi:hypothetical protein